MKRLFTFLLFSIGCYPLLAQENHHSGCSHEHCGLQGTGIDEFTFVPPPAGFVPGVERDVIISVTYNGFTPSAEAAFQYAVDIWASILTSSVPIQINANWSDLPGNTLGSAGASLYYQDINNGLSPELFYPSALADKITAVNQAPGQFDLVANFDSGTNWYLGTDGNTPGGQYDFVSVVLHELCHGLGMIGSPSVDGNNGLWAFNNAGGYMIYDNFVENGGGISITSFNHNSSALANQLQGEDLFWNGNSAVTANGGLLPRLYAPATWSGGSSYSHLNESTYPAGNPNSLMTPFIGAAEAIHDPGALQLGIMEDIGWDVTPITSGQCTPTGIGAEFACPTNDSNELYPAIQLTSFFTGECFVETVCVQEAGEPTPTCFNLQDFDIFLSTTEAVVIEINTNSSYNVWFTVDGQQSPSIVVETGVCIETPGCTNPFAVNFNPSANTDNGTCIYNQTVCDCEGTQHSIGVLTWLGDGFADDGSFQWEAELVDFNCAQWGYDCGDIDGAPNNDPFGVCQGNLPPSNGCGGAALAGCTNPEATNFNSSATVDDASCTYPSCDFYLDFEGFSNGEFVAQNSSLVTTWSGTEGGGEDAVVQYGNAANGNAAMIIEQTVFPEGGADDIFIPIGESSGMFNLDLDLFIYPGFGGYYNIQETTNPGDGWAMEVFLLADGSINIFQGETNLFSGTYTPGEWISVSNQVDLNSNILLVSVGSIVEFPVTFNSDLGGLNLFAFGGADPSYFLVDNVSLCGDGVPGCTNPVACNFDPEASTEDGSCEFDSCAGCTNIVACNFDSTATIEDGSCEFESCAGCTNIEACNFDLTATIDDGSCEFESCAGCTDPEACNFDEIATIDNFSCEYLSCAGCTDPEACNFDPEATLEDDSCDFESCVGCTDTLASNYSETATIDDGSCSYDFIICDCDGVEWSPSVRLELGNGTENIGGQLANFNCEEWGYDCGDIDGTPTMDPNGVCLGNLPANNGCGVGIDELGSAQWNLFPNPSNGVVYLSYRGPSTFTTVSVYDRQGRLVIQLTQQLTEGAMLTLNEKGQLAPGLYVVQILSGQNLTRQRFIID